jgi:hypothetical protein
MLHQLMLSASIAGCIAAAVVSHPLPDDRNDDAPFVVVLGIAQDGGVPHAGCDKDCCVAAWNDS